MLNLKMSASCIGPKDSLFRFCVYPTTYRSNAFAPNKFINLIAEGDQRVVGSLAWEMYAPSLRHLHEYGCRIAAGINAQRLAEGKTKPKYRNVYCGAYQLTNEVIARLAKSDGLGEVLSATVVHKIENGELAHAELRICLRPGIKVDIEGTKTAIIDRLWNSCRGPLLHECECDEDIKEHPGQRLPVPPLGEYLDGRSDSMRLWHLVRYFVYSWLWAFKIIHEP